MPVSEDEDGAATDNQVIGLGADTKAQERWWVTGKWLLAENKHPRFCFLKFKVCVQQIVSLTKYNTAAYRVLVCLSI